MLDRSACHARVNRCASLIELCNTLNSIMGELRTDFARTHNRETVTDDQRRAHVDGRLRDLVDFSQLLVFAPVGPPAGPWIYSWDTTHYLTYISGTDSDRWVVRPR
jgi:hypothetical protein